jgi:MMPL family/FtsX-like permease family
LDSGHDGEAERNTPGFESLAAYEPQAGLASDLINTSQQIGGALGLAVLSTIAYSHSHIHGGTGRPNVLTVGYTHALLVAACSLSSAGRNLQRYLTAADHRRLLGARRRRRLERAFADALGVHVGDTITLANRTFEVVGIAVCASIPTYPSTFDVGWSFHVKPTTQETPGLMWLSRSDVESLATPDSPLGYFLNLRLADPDQAPAFVAAHGSTNRAAAPNNGGAPRLKKQPRGSDQSNNRGAPPQGNNQGAIHLVSWQQIRDWDNLTVENVQQAMRFGSTLLGLLAIASVAILVGGRMTEQTRRVGLLKAVGGTPRLIVAILLAQQLTLALLAAIVGLLSGRLLAPLLTSAGTGLIGTAGTPSVGPGTIGIVIAVALGVASAATALPAFQAARTSTVRALANSARPPTRSARMIALSARLPIPLLLGLRQATRRPRRSLLNALGFLVSPTSMASASQAWCWASCTTAMTPTTGTSKQRNSASMDYQVFLLSRVREEIDAGKSARRAVIDGLAGTAKVIASAAAIMVAVFASFILNGRQSRSSASDSPPRSSSPASWSAFFCPPSCSSRASAPGG